jgi:hypothetical protein
MAAARVSVGLRLRKLAWRAGLALRGVSARGFFGLRVLTTSLYGTKLDAGATAAPAAIPGQVNSFISPSLFGIQSGE